MFLQSVLLVAGVGLSLAQAPDFLLQDVGTSSPRKNAVVSPRDYILQVSGYYFGAST